MKQRTQELCPVFERPLLGFPVLCLLAVGWGLFAGQGAGQVSALDAQAAGPAAGNAVKPAANAVKAAANAGNKAAPAPAEKGKPKAEEDEDDPFAGGAALDSDPEVENLLRRAEEYAREGNLRDAAVLYQHVLDRSGGTLSEVRPRSGLYQPMSALVHQRIAETPGLLQAYRLSADGEAQGLLDAAGDDPRRQIEAMRAVVQRFFVSSLGDDCAFRLACLAMDRLDFAGARRLLQDVLRHPDSDLPPAEVHLRLAAASARIGDARGLAQARERLSKAGASERQLRVAQGLGLGSVGSQADAAAPWRMTGGDPGRRGGMPPLDLNVASNALWTTVWGEPYVGAVRMPRVAGINYAIQNQPQQSRSQIIERWEQGGWLPTSQVALSSGRVYFKAYAHRAGEQARPALVALDAETGSVVWVGAEPAQPNLQNRAYISQYYSPQNAVEPHSAEEVAMFEHRAAKDLSVHGGVVYHLEGQVITGAGAFKRVQVMINGQFTEGRFGNILAAHEEATGRRLWQVDGMGWKQGAADEEVRRFLAAPTPAGNHLLTPVERATGLFIEARSTADGSLIWETFLCANSGNEERTSVLGLAVEGNEAYVATGSGLVFALEASGGRVQWAARYEQTLRTNQDAQRQGWRMNGGIGPRPTEGWDDDTVIPVGDTLLVTPSDASHLLFLDRRSGELIGRLPRDGSRYPLGVMDDALFVAGAERVWKISVRSGKRLAVAELAQGGARVVGRGVLTSTAVIIPRRDGTLLLSPGDLTPLGLLKTEAGAALAGGKPEPLGNLYCDGRSLIAAGMERVVALGDSGQRMLALSARAERGDADALITRAALHRQLGRPDDSLKDLRRAQALRPNEPTRTLLLQALLTRVGTQPVAAVAGPALDEAQGLSRTDAERAMIKLARARLAVSAGEAAVAIDLYLSLAADESRDKVTVAADDPDLKATIALNASMALRDLAKDPRAAALLTQRASQALEQALLAHREKESQEASEIERRLPQLNRHAAESEARHDKLQGITEGLENFATRLESRVKTLAAQLKVAEGRAAPQAELQRIREELETVKELYDKEAGNHLARKREVDAARAEAAAARAALNEAERRLPELRMGHRSHLGRLLTIRRMFPDTEAASVATLAAAQTLEERGEFERAEMVLMDLAISPYRPGAAAAIAALGRLHLKLGWREQAAVDASRLSTSFPGVTLAGGPERSAQQAASELMAQLQSQLQAQQQAPAQDPVQAPAQAPNQAPPVPGVAGVAGLVREMPPPPWKKAWEQGPHSMQRVGFGGDMEASEFTRSHLLFIENNDGSLRCRDVLTGKDRWVFRLDPGSNGNGNTMSNGYRYVRYRGFEFPNGDVMRYAHVAFMWSPRRVTALGMVSGKELWTATTEDDGGDGGEFERILAATPWGQLTRVARVASGAGVLAELRLDGPELEAAVNVTDVVTGQPRWLRRFPRESVVGVWVAGDHVAVVANAGNRILVCDRGSGRLLGQFDLPDRNERSQLLWHEDRLIYLSRTGLIARKLPTGETLWQAEHKQAGAPPMHVQRMGLFGPGVAYAVNYFPNGSQNILLVDAASGKRLADIPVTSFGRHLQDLAMSPDGKDLYVVAFSQSNRMVVAVVELPSGKLRLRIETGAAGDRVQAEALATAGDILPLTVRDLPTDLGKGRMRYVSTSRIVFFRKSDGKYLRGLKLPVGGPGGRLNNVQMLEIVGRGLIVGSQEGIFAITHDPKAPAPQLDPVDPAELDAELKRDQQKQSAAPPAPQIDPQNGPQGRAVPLAPVPGPVRLEVKQALPRINLNGARIELTPVAPAPVPARVQALPQNQAPQPAQDKAPGQPQAKVEEKATDKAADKSPDKAPDKPRDPAPQAQNAP